MAIKLCDLPIDELRAILRATELSAGTDSTSARIIRRELQAKEAGVRASVPDSTGKRVRP